ncbi:MBL fold metallo-hydrolase [Frigidibacter oleivorans]|uniref:MBL fold metallo-hydrolase n=1 Tax=Frigidibacter oleivorans TaxID=2487129 RepID=UPI001F1A4352|nr:MBL fold metallo-hydrolase [Frigidibacter oleivorans]
MTGSAPTRRQIFSAVATATLATPALLAAGTALAAAPMQEGNPMPQFHRVMLGAFEVTTLLAGTRPLENPHGTFGLNASDEDFAAAAAAALVPVEMSQNFFTPVLVNTGSELVLFDTGLSAEGTTAALTAAGYQPDQVDIVVLTHMHGDHIGGLMANGAPTYANARYVTGQAEFDHWSEAGNDGFEANVRPLADRMTFLGDGDEVVAGIAAMLTAGHTPGHMSYMLDSDGARLVLIADVANHFAFSVPHPDWEVRFDMDKPMAAETRRRVLGMIAEEGLPFIGYHMPFPALGYLQAEGESFRFVPASYQPMLPGFGT